jgi:hypothetical protein
VSPLCADTVEEAAPSAAVLQMAMGVEDVHNEIFRSCYRDGVKVYDLFVDEANRLRKQFLRSDGLVDENVVGAYEEGSDCIYRRGNTTRIKGGLQRLGTFFSNILVLA